MAVKHGFVVRQPSPADTISSDRVRCNDADIQDCIRQPAPTVTNTQDKANHRPTLVYSRCYLQKFAETRYLGFSMAETKPFFIFDHPDT